MFALGQKRTSGQLSEAVHRNENQKQELNRSECWLCLSAAELGNRVRQLFADSPTTGGSHVLRTMHDRARVAACYDTGGGRPRPSASSAARCSTAREVLLDVVYAG